MFYQEILKLKTPTIIYYVYKWNHVTISYKAQYIKLSIQSRIITHCHAETCISMHQFLASWQPASTAQSLLKKTPEWIWIGLALTAQSSLETPMCVICIECITIVTTDSPSHPFTYLSIGSPLELTCTLVNYCFCSIVSELLVVN